jgi:hypothetical protein
MLSKNLSDSKYWTSRQELGFNVIRIVFVLSKTAYVMSRKGLLAPEKAALSLFRAENRFPQQELPIFSPRGSIWA